MTTKIGYKLVREGDPFSFNPIRIQGNMLIRMSFNAVAGIDENCVEYTPGEWSKPKVKDTPLFFFASLADARGWTSNSKVTQIWECEVDRLTPLTKDFIRSRGISLGWPVEEWVEAWKGWRKQRGEACRGIFLCNKIKLTRLIRHRTRRQHDECVV